MSLVRRSRTAAGLLRQTGPLGLGRYLFRRYKYPLLQRAARWFPGWTPLRAPHTLQIEVSSKCNLRCPSCSLTREQLPGRTMSFDELDGFLDRLGFTPSNVSLNGIGEPLVNRSFFRIVDRLAERGVTCSFYTNGTLLDEQNRAEIVRRKNISFVGISCDGGSEEVFERLRFGSDFTSWKRNVGAFVADAAARTSEPLRTTLNTVLSRDNHHELRELVRLAHSLGFKTLQLSEMVVNDATSGAMALSTAEIDPARWHAALALGRQLGVEVALPSAAKRPRPHLNCLQPWEYVQISAEGDVLPCCAIFGSDKTVVMGNLHQQSLQEIWSGEPFRTFRATAARGTNELCNNCPYY